MQTGRECRTLNVTITTAGNLAAANGFKISEFNEGQVSDLSTGLTALTFYTSADGSNYYPAYDSTPTTPVLQSYSVTAGAPGTGKSYQLPLAVMGAMYLLIVGNEAGTCVVTIKS